MTRSTACRLALLAPLLLPIGFRSGLARTVDLEVVAGSHDRSQTPVSWKLPGNLRRETRFSLVRRSGDQEKPVDVQRDRLVDAVWFVVDELAAGETARYRLRTGRDAGRSPEASRQNTTGPAVEASNDGRSILFRVGGLRSLRYHYEVVAAPEGVGSHYDRSGYLHPLWTPSGRVVTNDFPKNHRHHHGVWFPWKFSKFEGRDINFWESGARQGRIECAKLASYGSGRVFGWLEADQRFVDLTAPDGEQTALRERWSIRVWSVDGGALFDLTSTQSALDGKPFSVRKNHYGGLGFRGADEWEGSEHCEFLTSEGRTREDGHATRAEWCDVGGLVDGQPTGVTICCHPENLRAPQNMRIHPKEPFFNFAPCQLGDFTIEPGKPLISRYRFWVHDGAADKDASEKRYADFAEPPEVHIAR